MTVPVLWCNWNPEAKARGYWDQGMLEAVLDGSLWRVPGAHGFEHHEVGDGEWPEVDGAVVVVPARHNADRRYVDALNARLARLDWALLVLTGDEAGEYPWGWLEMPERSARWVMGATNRRHPKAPHVPLGSGWPPWFRAALPVEPPTKDLDFAFAGQVTHVRRLDCARYLREWTGPCARLESKAFTEGVPPEEYAAVMARAKIAPAPSGPESPDSFRLYEALEAGCIPLADGQTPKGPEPGYWTFVFGEPPPFPEVYNWETMPLLMSELLEEWPANANRVGAWWSQWKRNLAWRFHLALDELAGPRTSAPDDEITVVIPTSPSPMHPSTEHLARTIGSVRAHLPTAEIVVALDPPRPELEHRRADWDEFVRRTIWSAQREWANVVVMLRPEWGHEANVVRDALHLVRTPLMLLVEYDAPLVEERPIDWAGCVAAIHSGAANMIRFLHEGEIIPEHAHLVTGPQQVIEGVPLIPTMQYSSRPHLAPAWLYRDYFERWFPPESRTMIEDPLYGIINKHGPETWERWRIWIYADDRPDGSIQHSYHLDGRQDDPKFSMDFGDGVWR